MRTDVTRSLGLSNLRPAVTSESRSAIYLPMDSPLTRKLVVGVASTVMGLAAMALTAGCARDAASTSPVDPSTTLSPGQPSTTFAPRSRPPYILVDQFDGDSRLEVLEITTAADAIVDTTGLEVYVACAREWAYYATVSKIRIKLLTTGCAKVTAANPSAEESAAQKIAQEQKLGVWQTSGPSSTSTTSPSTQGGSEAPVGSEPSVVAGFLGWLGRNWFSILSFLLALLSVTWISKAIDRWRHKREVDIILTGLPGAGKTDLWTAWHDDTAPNSNAKPTVGIKRSTSLPAAPWGEHTLYPTVVDGAGADPAGMLNFIKKVPRRHKRVLIFVVAPCGSNVVVSSAFDHDYVVEQRGYSSFPRAILGAADKRIKPNLVVIFLTKFDLLSKIPPGDTANSDLRIQIDREFDGLVRSIRSDCKREKIPFQFIVGSAKTGWGVKDLRENVTKILVTSRR